MALPASSEFRFPSYITRALREFIKSQARKQKNAGFAQASLALLLERHGRSHHRERYGHQGDHAMNMNDYNSRLATHLSNAISNFEAGSITLEKVQSALQSAIPLFENDGSGVAELVRLAEADLEGIQFSMLLDEQRPAAIFRLDELSEAIGSVDDT